MPRMVTLIPRAVAHHIGLVAEEYGQWRESAANQTEGGLTLGGAWGFIVNPSVYGTLIFFQPCTTPTVTYIRY